MTEEKVIEISQKYRKKRVEVQTKKGNEIGILIGHFFDEQALVIEKENQNYTISIPYRKIVKISCIE